MSEINWDELQAEIVASLRADLLIGIYDPEFTMGQFFREGVKVSVAEGIAAYQEKKR